MLPEEEGLQFEVLIEGHSKQTGLEFGLEEQKDAECHLSVMLNDFRLSEGKCIKKWELGQEEPYTPESSSVCSVVFPRMACQLLHIVHSDGWGGYNQWWTSEHSDTQESGTRSSETFDLNPMIILLNKKHSREVLLLGWFVRHISTSHKFAFVSMGFMSFWVCGCTSIWPDRSH